MTHTLYHETGIPFQEHAVIRLDDRAAIVRFSGHPVPKAMSIQGGMTSSEPYSITITPQQFSRFPVERIRTDRSSLTERHYRSTPVFLSAFVANPVTFSQFTDYCF